MRLALISLSVLVLFSFFWPPAASGIELTSVELGILVVPVQYPCPVNPKTSKWAINDWDTSIVLLQRDIKEGDRSTAEVTAPNGRVFPSTTRWRSTASRGCTQLFIPILGTDAETWLGTWKASIFLNDRKVAGVSWEVVPARDSALSEYQAYLKDNPNSARAHYRVGAAAALAGQDALAETELLAAMKISPTWWYPYLALGRFYHRQGKKDLALEQFHRLKGLLLGRRAEPGTFVAYIQAMLDDHLKELEGN